MLELSSCLIAPSWWDHWSREWAWALLMDTVVLFPEQNERETVSVQHILASISIFIGNYIHVQWWFIFLCTIEGHKNASVTIVSQEDSIFKILQSYTKNLMLSQGIAIVIYLFNYCWSIYNQIKSSFRWSQPTLSALTRHQG